MSLSWVARRRGDRRCAPACGRGCTQAEYESALAFAKQIAKRLGKGWRAKVTENLGWHAKAAKGTFEVSGKRFSAQGKSLTLYMASCEKFGVLGQGKTPGAALGALRTELQFRVNESRAVLAELEK